MIDIQGWRLALAFLMAIVPLGVFLWMGVPLVGRTLTALVRMVVQLLFVGLYLKVVFDLDRPWLTVAWLLLMVVVADLSVVRGCGLRLAKVGPVLLVALLGGTLLPLVYFTGVVLRRGNVWEAQYAIPLGGMVLGNCLRADIVALTRFFESLREGEKPYLLALSQGASLWEAVRPHARRALDAALAPTVATMATIGLVSLPGMMTGVILAGADPVRAVKYQMVIMLAIFCGTAVTVATAIVLAMRTVFTRYGLLDGSVFGR
ncbi:MAG: ABC transporter permease [bacterium]|nr:ABC transporter permease [bacterium]